MSEMKRCKQCGLLKEAESFRPYTYAKQKDTQGRYRICRQCEAINSTYKRALQIKQGSAMYAEGPHGTETFPENYEQCVATVEKIEKLYKTLSARGLSVPSTRPVNAEPAVAAVDKLLDFYRADTQLTSTVEHAHDSIPTDLSSWLEADWQTWLDNDLSPEYLQETVYESLKAKYRPQTGIDKDKLLPVYDDTYKAVLNEILKKFDDYEEFCAAQEE